MRGEHIDGSYSGRCVSECRGRGCLPTGTGGVIQDKMLNWVIRGVTLSQSYKKEDYIPITPGRFEGLRQFTYSAGAASGGISDRCICIQTGWLTVWHRFVED